VIFSIWLCLLRSLHQNGIDDLLIYIGSSPDEVGFLLVYIFLNLILLFFVHLYILCFITFTNTGPIIIIITLEKMVYAYYWNHLFDAARTGNLCFWGVKNGKFKTLWDSESSIFLCKTSRQMCKKIETFEILKSAQKMRLRDPWNFARPNFFWKTIFHPFLTTQSWLN